MLPQPQTLTLAPAGNHSPVLFGGKGKVFILDVIENLELEFIFKTLAQKHPRQVENFARFERFIAMKG